MRISAILAVGTTLLAAIVSCGSDPDPETVDSLSIEVITDTVSTEEPVTAEVSEQQQATVETVPLSADPAGIWDTTMGQLELVADDSNRITGIYPLGTLEGTLTADVLQFTYSEGSLTGEGSFTFEEDFDSFTGAQDIGGTEFVWDGRRL
ncbi:MAG: hypothetical protein ABFR50_04860 [Candidatus Fermentibacteria bacterium]